MCRPVPLTTWTSENYCIKKNLIYPAKNIPTQNNCIFSICHYNNMVLYFVNNSCVKICLFTLRMYNMLYTIKSTEYVLTPESVNKIKSHETETAI